MEFLEPQEHSRIQKWSTILTANSYIICQPKQMDHKCTSSDLFEIIQNHSNCTGIYGTSEKNQGHQHRPSNLIIFEIRATLVHTVAVMRVDTFLQTQETREYRVGLPTKSFQQLQGFQELACKRLKRDANKFCGKNRATKLEQSL